MEITVIYGLNLNGKNVKYLNHKTQFSKLLENVGKSILSGMTDGECQTANLPSCMGDGSSELKQDSRLLVHQYFKFESLL